MTLDQLTLLLLEYRYWVLFPLACIEGPLVAFVVGSLVAVKFFNLFGAFAILLAGDVIPDVAYYLIGHYGQKSERVTRKVAKLKGAGFSAHSLLVLWRRRGFRMMVLSKLAYGLSTALLISAGLSRMPFSRFILYAFPVSVLQYGLCLAGGYYLGATLSVSTSVLEAVQIGALALAVMALLQFGLRRWWSKRMVPSLPSDEL